MVNFLSIQGLISIFPSVRTKKQSSFLVLDIISVIMLYKRFMIHNLKLKYFLENCPQQLQLLQCTTRMNKDDIYTVS